MVFAASNAYDHVYMHRQLLGGLSPNKPTIWPWPGTSRHLAPIPYTGGRAEVLMCCGNAPYNKAIRWMDEVIRAHGNGSGGGGGGGAPLRFVWPKEL